MSKKINFGLAIVVGVLIVLSIIGALTGYLYAGFKSPNQKIGAHWSICGKGVIDSYNKALESQSQEELQKSIGAVAEDVAKKDNFTRDANCNYIVLAHHLGSGDVAAVEKAYSNFNRSLSSSVLSSDFADLKGRSQLKVMVDMHKYANDSNSNNPDEPNG